MPEDDVIAPDGKSWYVSIPPDRNRVVFCRPVGRTWQLYRFAKGEQGPLRFSDPSRSNMGRWKR